MARNSGPASEAGAATGVAPRWIVVSCDVHWIGLPLARVREIVLPLPFTRLPGCGPAVCGLVSLRGAVVTVFDLGAALGLVPATQRPDHRIALVQRGERLYGLAVEGIVGVAYTPAETLPVDAAALRQLDVERDELLGVGALDEVAFLAIDPEPLLARLLG
jgi:chemotaxis signal transduction protein